MRLQTQTTKAHHIDLRWFEFNNALHIEQNELFPCLPDVCRMNCIPNLQYDAESINLVANLRWIRCIQGLCWIIKVACGMHHEAVLFEGVATDQPMPIWNEFVGMNLSP